MFISTKTAERGKLEWLKFQFNPTQISDTGGREKINITSANMKPLVSTVGYKPKTFTFELYFTDRYSKAYTNEVRKVIEFYRDYAEPVTLVLGKFFAGKVQILDAPCVFEEFTTDFSVVAFKTTITVQVV